MADKYKPGGTRPPLHKDPRAEREDRPEGRPVDRPVDRPVPKRAWRHARYGDAPDPPTANSRAKMFSEEADAEATGDARPHKP